MVPSLVVYSLFLFSQQYGTTWGEQPILVGGFLQCRLYGRMCLPRKGFCANCEKELVVSGPRYRNNILYIHICGTALPVPPPPMVMGQTSTPPPVVVVLWLGCGGLGLV